MLFEDFTCARMGYEALQFLVRMLIKVDCGLTGLKGVLAHPLHELPSKIFGRL